MLLDRRAHPFSEALIFAALLVAVLIVPLFALSLGAVEMPLGDLLRLLWDGDPARAVERAILWEIRLPRVLLALVSGAALAVAGALMQTLFRNPLADPGLIGSSAGAALAAAIVLIALPEWLALASWVLPLSAFVGALLAMLAALALASRDGRYAVADLLLAGIAINALCSSAIGLLVYLAADDQLRAFTLWTLGSLAAAKPAAVAAVALALLLAFALAFWQRRALDALLLGEGEAASLGVPVEWIKRLALVGAALVVGSVVAFAGIIGFIGLIVPNLVRMLLGPRHGGLLPASALLGASLLALADLLARVLARPLELPLGILTALLGAPFFLALLRRRSA